MTTETLPAVAPERVTPLLPSEALKLGRLTRPVRLEWDFLRDDDAACALGAISVGYGFDMTTDDGNAGWMEVLRGLPLGCPLDCKPKWGGGVAHLNDDHHWSDDQIVAWLQSMNL